MAYTCTSPEDVLRTIKDDSIEMVDLRFTDLVRLREHLRLLVDPSIAAFGPKSL
jgi:glutamine synthetase